MGEFGGCGRIRTYVDLRRQIYSLVPLTTRPHTLSDTFIIHAFSFCNHFLQLFNNFLY